METDYDKTQESQTETDLTRKSRSYKAALDNDIRAMKEKAADISKIALIAGGATLGAYVLYRILRNPKQKNQEIVEKSYTEPPRTHITVEKPRTENTFLRVLKEQLALVLVSAVTEKISELTGLEKTKLQEKQYELTGKARPKQEK